MEAKNGFTDRRAGAGATDRDPKCHGEAGAPQAPKRFRSALGRLGDSRIESLRISGAAFLWSRLWVFLCGVFAFLTFQPNRATGTIKFDDPHLTHVLGRFGDIAVGVWARWDSLWYLQIADRGYADDGSAAFFPLYPLLGRLGGFVFGGFDPTQRSIFIAELALSLLAFGASLYVLHRLVTLESGRRFAEPTVLLVAFFPMSIFFSAVYSESLFLFLSVTAFYCARTDRWAWAGLLGGLAAGTRSAGILILVPLVVMYLWGPRSGPGPRGGQRGTGWARLRPRYRLRPNALWLLLVPVGLGSFALYLQLALGDPTIFLSAQKTWLRHATGPIDGMYQAGSAAFQGVRQLVVGENFPVYWTSSKGTPLRVAGLNIELFAFMCCALWMLVGTFRRLPAAYGWYGAATLLLPLSTPVATIPLMSLPRFMAVVFPLFIWLAIYVEEKRKVSLAVALSAMALGLFTAQWATWNWVS